MKNILKNILKNIFGNKKLTNPQTFDKATADKFIQKINRYKDNIEKNYPLIFDNNNFSHAVAGVKTLLDFSEQEILIYSNQLQDKFYREDYIKDAVVDFLQRNDKVKLTILVRDRLKPEHKFLKFLKTLPAKNKKKITIKSLKSERDQPYKNNFIVADKRYLRLEKDENNYTARLAFNEIVAAKELVNKFDKSFKGAKRI